MATDSARAFLEANRDALCQLLSDSDEAFKDPEKVDDGVAVRLLIRQKISDLLRATHQVRPPINLYKLASLCGIRRISKRALDVEGRIIRIQGGYEVELNGSSPRLRQRFSLAHELAHTFFLDFVPELTRNRAVGSAAVQDWKREETLCNYGAGEFLMPAEAFVGEALKLGPSLRALHWLAYRWDVSKQACAVRLSELSVWPVVVLHFGSHVGGFALRWTAGLSQGVSGCVSANFKLESPFAKILVRRQSWHGMLTLKLGGPAANYFCDVQPASDGQSATIMVVLSKEPERLMKASQLRVWQLREQNRQRATTSARSEG